MDVNRSQSPRQTQPLTGPLPDLPVDPRQAVPAARPARARAATDSNAVQFAGARSQAYQTETLPQPAVKKRRRKKSCGSKIVGGLKKVGSFVKKALPIASTVMSFVPGLNVAGLAMKAVSWASKGMAVVDAVKNKGKGLLGAATGFLGGLGGGIGDAVGKFMNGSVGQIIQKGTSVLDGFRSGGIQGALGAAGGAIGGDAGRAISTGTGVASALQRGDLAGAVGAVQGVTGENRTVQQIAGGLQVAQAARSGDLVGAARAADTTFNDGRIQEQLRQEQERLKGLLGGG